MILEQIKNRRSIRKYKADKPVTKEQLKTLLEAAMLSPSACNTRPWRFIAITCRETLNKLAENHQYAKMLNSATACILVVALPGTQEGHKDDLPKGFFPQDCGAVTQTILLQAESMGLGTCWCGVYPKEGATKGVREIIEIPADEVPFCLIAVGTKDENPSPRGKFEEEKISWI